ncbi:hypothetical protein HDU96_008466 [Phlyctochytrium bullatum]|nr:hypothetical protein HDU96_008466 [Phlyctochytrium bullatum]
MLLTDLATESMISVAQYLLPGDLLNLACSSKHFRALISSDYVWQRMLEKRFPAIDRCGNVNYKEEYRTAASLRLKADKLGIPWLDGHYWKLIPSEDGDGLIAELRRVCWLEVSARFKSVPKGIYVPSFKIRQKSELVSYQLTSIEFGCGILGDEEGQIQRSTTALWSTVFAEPGSAPVGTWVSVRLDPIVVDRDYAEISVWMRDLGRWKSGLFVAEFGLEKASSSPSAAASGRVLQ